MAKTILAVDDSSSLRQMVAFTLEGAGYRVVQAEDGLDALVKVAQARPDMVITDLNMPKLDGIGLIRKQSAIAQREIREVGPNHFIRPMPD